MFQFPSNGKLHSNPISVWAMWELIRVSIPFKRETAFKQKITSCTKGWSERFQFPSNGKLHSNCSLVRQSVRIRYRVSIPFKRETAFKHRTPTTWTALTQVSIPFKRETAFKLSSKASVNGCIPSFNSLQTGNCIQTSWPIWPTCRQPRVSIPFKRETAFKRGRKRNENRTANQFQFPSNGKLHSNKISGHGESFPDPGFNSLQTGNCIQTRFRRKTGKDSICVSIPFKRETAFKPVPPQGITTHY